LQAGKNFHRVEIPSKDYSKDNMMEDKIMKYYFCHLSFCLLELLYPLAFIYPLGSPAGPSVFSLPENLR